MTEKEKQIIEMAQLKCNKCNRYKTDGICILDYLECDGNCGWYQDAENLYNKGFRKVPDGAVVLTKEEYDTLMKNIAEIIKAWSEAMKEAERLHNNKLDLEHQLTQTGLTEYVGADVIEEQASKETAKAIYIAGKYYYAKHSPTERQLSDFLAHIKDTYDVEEQGNE